MDIQMQKIISAKARPNERLEAYQFLIRVIQEAKDVPAKFLDDFNSVLDVLKQDINNPEVKLSLESLHLIGIFLRTDMIVTLIEEKKMGEIIDDLCILIKKSPEKMVCTRALWCLAKLKVPLILWIEKLQQIMEIIQKPQPDDPKQMSGSYELEIIRVLNRLLTEMPEQMALRVSSWSRRLYLATVHPMGKVREPALVVLESVWSVIQKHQTQQSLVMLVGDLKEKLVPGMARLFKEKQEIQSLRLWRLLLKLLGKALHQGASLINTLLGIVEKGFKSPNPEVKVEAFNSWHQLIVNFGSELEVLANPKRLRLVMQPLKANNARTEMVAKAKFNVWWFLIIVLGPKLILNLEMVLHPFLQFCFGLDETISNNQPGPSPNNSMNNSSIHTPDSVQKMSLNTSTSSSNLSGTQKFMTIHRSGCEALAQILGHKSDLPISQPSFTIDELPFTVLESPQTFLHHYKIVLSCVKKAIIGLGAEKKDLHLQLYLLHNAVLHVKVNAEGDNKKEFSEALSLLLYTFESFVRDENFSPEVLLKLLEVSTFIPKKVLHSSAYTIEEASVMSGTPSLFLIKLLFRSPFLQHSSTERFGSIFQKLISENEDSTVDTLSFTELVMKTIDSASVDIGHSETLFRLWNIVATNLLEKIETTKEINQGDSLEHDFGCIYAVLMFPINHLYTKPLLQSSIKSLDATWINLCKKLGKLEDLVPKVPVNIWCEEFSSKILNNIPDESFKLTLMQENLSNLLLVIITLVDFSSADKIIPDGESKENWMKRKSKPIGFISTFIFLYSKLVSSVMESEKELAEKAQSTISTIFKSMSNLSNVAKILFTNMTYSQCLIPLLNDMKEPVSSLFVVAEKIKSFQILHDNLVPNIEEMWEACVKLVKNNYEGVNDLELFRVLCPLLEASLYYSSTSIREKTNDMWRATFMLSPTRLNLPESFKTVFRHLKINVVPESGRQVATALSALVCLSQEEDDEKKMMLELKENAATTELINKSPLILPKKHGLESDNLVASDAKRRRILTETQKEIIPILSDGSSAPYLNQDALPPLPLKPEEDLTNMELENSKQEVATQLQAVEPEPMMEVTVEEKSIEISTTTSPDIYEEVITSSIQCKTDLDSSEKEISNTPVDLNQTAIESDSNLSSVNNVQQVEETIQSVDVEMTPQSEQECITNGKKDILSVGGVDLDDIIPSSQILKSVTSIQDEDANQSKSTNVISNEEQSPLLKLHKESLKRGSTKHRARRSMRFADIPETPSKELGPSDSSADFEKISPIKISETPTSVKRRRRSSHRLSDVHEGVTKSVKNKNKEEEIPEEKRRHKTARKSFPLSPVKLGNVDANGSATKIKKISSSDVVEQESVLGSARRQLRCRLTRLESGPTEKPTEIHKLEIESGDGVKPMDLESENLSIPCQISKFQNLLKSPILNDPRNTRDSKAGSISSDASILDDPIAGKRSKNDESLEEGEISSPVRTPRKRSKRKQSENEPKKIESSPDRKPISSDSTVIADTDVEMRNASPDLDTIGSEITVGSEVVVNVTADVEKDVELVNMGIEVGQNKLEQSNEQNQSIVQSQPDVVLSNEIETKQETTKDEQSIRKLCSDEMSPSTRSVKLVPVGNSRTEESVPYSPHRRYIKTYSKGTPVVETPKTESFLPINSSLMQRVGSRGLKFLQAAAKQNLSNLGDYEKMKYDNKKGSPLKSPERKSLDFFNSPDMSSTPIGTPERMKKFSKTSYISPAGSPSVGILKKQLKRLEVPLGSPSNKRRVSFADPLVQVSTEVLTKPEEKEEKKSVEIPESTNLKLEPVVELKRITVDVVQTESMPVLEKQIPFELESGSSVEETVEALVEPPLVQPPQLEIAAVTEIESSVEEIGANTEIISGIEAIETVNETSESKNEQLVTLEDEVMGVQAEVDLSQRDMNVIEEVQVTCQLNTSPEVPEIPEIQMEVLVPIDNQVTVKQDETTDHVLTQSDAPETLLSIPQVCMDSDLSEMINNLNSKFTIEEISKSSTEQLLSFHGHLLNMATVVTKVLALNRTSSGSDC